MIRSMTAFASAECETAFGNLSIELRSVNHRYLEISPRLPDGLRSFETPLREFLTARLTRGKVDVTVRLKATAARASALDVEEDLLHRLAGRARERRSPARRTAPRNFRRPNRRPQRREPPRS